MRGIFTKIKNNLLLYSVIFIIFNILLNFILYLFNLKFRLWFIIFIILVSIVSLIGGIILRIKKNGFTLLIKRLLVLFSFLICIFFVVIFQYFKAISFAFAFIYRPEHTTKLDDKKYVAVVSSFLNVDVDYYDYYGPFIMGTKARVHGYFGKGGYDPFINKNTPDSVCYTYYDNNGKVMKEKTITFIKDKNGKIVDYTGYDQNFSNEKDFNSNTNYILPEEEEVLYEKKFKKTVLRFTRVDYVIGQRMLVHVLRSNDNGENFHVVTDEVIQVSNEAEFIFLNEELGFAVSTGKIYLDKDIISMYVTNDGGKTFNGANFNYENENAEFISVEKLPCFDKNTLKIKCSVYEFNKEKDSYEDKELKFISNDNGLNWSLE